MSTTVKKAESGKTKRFTVSENGQEVLNTSKKDEALEKISALKKERKPLIILLDNQEKKSTHYSKSIHQQNYRVEAGNFEKDSAAPVVAEIAEPEE